MCIVSIQICPCAKFLLFCDNNNAELFPYTEEHVLHAIVIFNVQVA